MRTTARAAVDQFVAQPALALVGVSRSGKKFGNAAYRELSAKGYRVYPIHPSADVIDGVRCYSRFVDLPEAVDAVLVVVPPSQAAAVVRDAAAAGIHHVWLQQGVESNDALKACHDLGLTCVWGECILMFAKPTSYHKAHRWLNAMTRQLPAS
jgi:predicted CoA-binding protein